MQTCAIMQPTYLPWLGYFDLLDQCDLFVILDSVQLTRPSWQTRNRIKSATGAEIMLSIPVRRTSLKATAIRDAEVNDDAHWRRKHLASVEENYRRAPYHRDPTALYKDSLALPTQRLTEITTDIIRRFTSLMGISTKIVTIGEVGEFTAQRDELLVAVCRAVGATGYLSPPGSAAYIEGATKGGAFAGSGITLAYQNYVHPTYPQTGAGFLPYLGTIDLLCNVPGAEALDVIRSGRREPLRSDQMRRA